jgi:type II secretory pathway pseudopilin PulG
MNDGTIPFLVFGVIAVVVIWQLFARSRAKVMASREAEYHALADRAVRAQELAESRMASVGDQFNELNRRLTRIEGVLKDAE